jgi:hypothetical protein
VGLNEAMETASTLAEALENALHDAEAETDALRRFAHGPVLECALRREAFNLESAELLSRLNGQLADSPRTPELRRKLEELRRLGKDLTAADATNRDMAGRALVFTQAYLNALLPRAQAYNRRGEATRQPAAPSTLSQRS